MTAPIALFAYKRSWHLKLVLEALSRNVLATESSLYIFCDGPKTEEDVSAVQSVRALAREAAGFSELRIIERPRNLGLAQSIITGVTEILDHNDRVIVLEDDLITAPNFLTYMNAALAHYEMDPHIFSVTGHTFPDPHLKIPRNYPYDTYAGYRCSSWSWGTWPDRWRRVDWQMRDYDAFMRNSEAQAAFDQGGDDMTLILRLQHEGKLDSWAIRFGYAHFKHSMHCIYPTKTLVRNIGLDHTGTHSVPNPRFYHERMDESILPRRFCPGAPVNPKIAQSFRALFAPPPSRPAALRGLAGKIKRRLRPASEPVDILIVNTYEREGGAARAAYRCFQGVRSAFPAVRYLTLIKDDADPDVLGHNRASQKGVLAQSSLGQETAPLSRYSNRPNTYFSPGLSPSPVRMPLSRYHPKLAHLHWVAQGILRVEDLVALRCPVVWTLHDAWAFSGGCHYPSTCEGFKHQCGFCPQLASHREDDLSRLLWQRKEAVYERLDLTVVSPSKWLLERAKDSALFRGRRMEVIPNGLDTDVFKPIDRFAARHYLGLPRDQPVLLFGSHQLNDPRKGLDLLCGALRHWTEPVVLLIFGHGSVPMEGLAHVTLRQLGTLGDDMSLALAYSAADVVVCPSREDNFPNIVAEAMACGTPCAAFGINGLPDMIAHRKTGWLAPPFDIIGLAEGLRWLTTQAELGALRAAARAKALDSFSMSGMTRRYKALYSELIAAADKTPASSIAFRGAKAAPNV